MHGIECVDFIPATVDLLFDFIYAILWICVMTWFISHIKKVLKVVYYLVLMMHYDGWYSYMVAEEQVY